MPNLLAQRIEEVLRPIVGVVLASVSLEIECKRIGRSPETVCRDDLPRLAQSLSVALRLVVGADLAEAAAKRVLDLT